MQYFERQNDSLIFRLNGETVMVSPWGEDSLRTRAALFNELSDNSPALLSPAKSEPVIELGERQAVITNGKIHAVLSLQDWGDELQISYYNQKGELLLQEIPNGGALFLKARRFQSLPGDSFFLTASFVSNPSEKIYGMGQYQQETLNLKGCNLELAHRNSQASIPFYVSSLGYGFLWNNAAVGDVHFGTNTTQWTARSCKQLDYWITAGDTPAEIEEAYANATGKSPMMPEYGLGFWQCKLRYYNQEQVLSIAREYKKRNIPLDVIVIDFYHWPYCGDWRFDEEFFPDPAAMIKELQELGVETMVSIWPAVDFRSENYEEMKQQNMLVKSNSGVDVQMIFHGNNAFMDATNPKTRRYVWEKCKQNYADLGIRTFWLDVAEPEYIHFEPLAFTPNKIKVTNWHDFIGLEGYTLRWAVECDGKTVQNGEMDFPKITPRNSANIELPLKALPADGKEYFLTLRAFTKHEAPLVPKGHEVAIEQWELPSVPSAKTVQPVEGTLTVNRNNEALTVKGNNFQVAFSTRNGEMTELNYNGKNLIKEGLQPNFWRPLTDNDIPNRHLIRCGTWKNAGRDAKLQHIEVAEAGQTATVTATYRMEWRPLSFGFSVR